MSAQSKVRVKDWWEDCPPAGRTLVALRKVFDMARCIPGSQDRETRDGWEDWLDTMERYWLGTGLPSCQTTYEPPPAEPALPFPVGVEVVRVVGQARRCSLCGIEGHRRTTCALNPKNVKTEPDR